MEKLVIKFYLDVIPYYQLKHGKIYYCVSNKSDNYENMTTVNIDMEDVKQA